MDTKTKNEVLSPHFLFVHVRSNAVLWRLVAIRDVKELKLKANHNTRAAFLSFAIDVKELKLKANHNFCYE